jgi:hypothetical protein
MRWQNNVTFFGFSMLKHHHSDQHNPAVHVLQLKLNMPAHPPAHYSIVEYRTYPPIFGNNRQRLVLLLRSEIKGKQ